MGTLSPNTARYLGERGESVRLSGAERQAAAASAASVPRTSTPRPSAIPVRAQASRSTSRAASRSPSRAASSASLVPEAAAALTESLQADAAAAANSHARRRALSASPQPPHTSQTPQRAPASAIKSASTSPQNRNFEVPTAQLSPPKQPQQPQTLRDHAATTRASSHLQLSRPPALPQQQQRAHHSSLALADSSAVPAQTKNEPKHQKTLGGASTLSPHLSSRGTAASHISRSSTNIKSAAAATASRSSPGQISPLAQSMRPPQTQQQQLGSSGILSNISETKQLSAATSTNALNASSTMNLFTSKPLHTRGSVISLTDPNAHLQIRSMQQQGESSFSSSSYKASQTLHSQQQLSRSEQQQDPATSPSVLRSRARSVSPSPTASNFHLAQPAALSQDTGSGMPLRMSHYAIHRSNTSLAGGTVSRPLSPSTREIHQVLMALQEHDQTIRSLQGVVADLESARSVGMRSEMQSQNGEDTIQTVQQQNHQHIQQQIQQHQSSIDRQQNSIKSLHTQQEAVQLQIQLIASQLQEFDQAFRGWRDDVERRLTEHDGVIAPLMMSMQKRAGSDEGMGKALLSRYMSFVRDAATTMAPVPPPQASEAPAQQKGNQREQPQQHQQQKVGVNDGARTSSTDAPRKESAQESRPPLPTLNSPSRKQGDSGIAQNSYAISNLLEELSKQREMNIKLERRIGQLESHITRGASFSSTAAADHGHNVAAVAAKNATPLKSNSPAPAQNNTGAPEQPHLSEAILNRLGALESIIMAMLHKVDEHHAGEQDSEHIRGAASSAVNQNGHRAVTKRATTTTSTAGFANSDVSEESPSSDEFSESELYRRIDVLDGLVEDIGQRAQNILGTGLRTSAPVGAPSLKSAHATDARSPAKHLDGVLDGLTRQISGIAQQAHAKIAEAANATRNATENKAGTKDDPPVSTGRSNSPERAQLHERDLATASAIHNTETEARIKDLVKSATSKELHRIHKRLAEKVDTTVLEELVRHIATRDELKKTIEKRASTAVIEKVVDKRVKALRKSILADVQVDGVSSDSNVDVAATGERGFMAQPDFNARVRAFIKTAVEDHIATVQHDIDLKFVGIKRELMASAESAKNTSGGSELGFGSMFAAKETNQHTENMLTRVETRLRQELKMWVKKQLTKFMDESGLATDDRLRGLRTELASSVSERVEALWLERARVLEEHQDELEGVQAVAKRLTREFDEKLYMLCSDLSACKSLFAQQVTQPFYRCGQWLWKSGTLKMGSGVPWNYQTVNTEPDNFKWDQDQIHLRIADAGLYEISMAFFTKSKPSIQLVVNGESVLSAINSPSYVVHHSSGFVVDGEGRVEPGTVTGISLVDFLALPSKSTISVHYHGVRKTVSPGHGFVALRRL